MGEKYQCIIQTDKIMVDKYGSNKIILCSSENTIGFDTMNLAK